MPLEDGYDAFPDDDENHWELGGLTLEVTDGGDDGLDDVAEVEGEDQDAAGDGSISGDQRLASRPIKLSVRLSAPDGTATEATAAAIADAANELRKVMSVLPDRTATRMLRWKRYGEVAKRIAVRPARGKPLSLPGDIRRLVHDHATPDLHLDAPDPVILSDEYHEHIFAEAGEATITNAGSFCAVNPGAWWLESAVPVTIENEAFDEYVHFPDTGITVSRDRIVVGATTYGIFYGPGSTLFPRWPLLRPGDNTIKASAPCTFRWRDTW